jgi:uncharacterized protein
MKIAIISDIHDNIVNLEKAIKWCNAEKVGAIVCAGDITNAETLEFLATKFVGTIYLIRGNMEIYEEAEIKNYKNINYYGRFGVANIEGKNIGICHEPAFISDLLKDNKCDSIFYGHTHRPWFEEREGVKLINPGTLGGVFQRASFAVWEVENNKIDLNLLELI